MDATTAAAVATATVQHTPQGQPFQVVAWTQQWLLLGGRWCRVAEVYTNGQLRRWAFPDDTQD